MKHFIFGFISGPIVLVSAIAVFEGQFGAVLFAGTFIGLAAVFLYWPTKEKPLWPISEDNYDRKPWDDKP